MIDINIVLYSYRLKDSSEVIQLLGSTTVCIESERVCVGYARPNTRVGGSTQRKAPTRMGLRSVGI